ncbi:MAG: hypothetical protein M5U28_17890 [Sandaracinaceae bacterium]|nr:hypothetical protein [Sandaracinaceae bacterium]
MDPSARHLFPWKRGPYVAVLLGAVLALLAWVIVAVSTLLSGNLDSAPLCPLVCVGLALVGVSMPAAIWRRRGMGRARTTLARNEDALAALRGGRYAEAEAIWNELCHDSRHAPALHTLYVLNLGVAWMHLGRLAQARALIERARTTGWLTSSALGHAGPQAEVGYALCLALAGRARGRAARARDGEARPRRGAARGHHAGRGRDRRARGQGAGLRRGGAAARGVVADGHAHPRAAPARGLHARARQGRGVPGGRGGGRRGLDRRPPRRARLHRRGVAGAARLPGGALAARLRGRPR